MTIKRIRIIFALKKFSTVFIICLKTMSNIKKTVNNVSMELSVFVYKDSTYANGQMYIAYCPALDLAGYDTTEKGAKRSFEVVVNDYIEDTLSKGTLEQDLLAHGWRKKNGKMAEPSYKSLFIGGKLTDIIKRKEYSKYSVPVGV